MILNRLSQGADLGEHNDGRFVRFEEFPSNQYLIISDCELAFVAENNKSMSRPSPASGFRSRSGRSSNRDVNIFCINMETIASDNKSKNYFCAIV